MEKGESHCGRWWISTDGFPLRRSLLVLILCWNLSSTWSFCPPYCACDDIALSVNCHSTSNLRVVPIFLNPQIKYLSLANNQIKDITLSLQFYAELNLLDISLNSIQSLGKQNFELLKNLKVLNVSYNSVKTLENSVFTGLRALEVLDLTGNQIERVEREIFWNLQGIKEIILDRNRLEFIDWDLFRGLDTLERISVQFNFIQVIEPSASLGTLNSNAVGAINSPWTLKNVRILDVSSNQLTRVKDFSLVVFGGLRELNLCCNYIHTLEERAFSGSSGIGIQLEKVNLSQNRLGRVPTESLVKVGASLRELDISSNRISDEFPKGAFRTLYQLQNLRVSDNPGVLSIHPDALTDNVNLVGFEADYLSNLTELSATLLENKPGLESFSVKYAHVSSLPGEMLQPPVLPSIRALDLTGNPIDCNCSVYPLFQYLEQVESEDESFNRDPSEAEALGTFGTSNLSQAQYVDPSNKNNGQKQRHLPSYLSSVRCQSPVELSGILVKDLKSSDFGECFAGEDNFQLMVICIGAAIVSLILLAVGIKLCCASGGCRRVSNFCKNHHCCHRLRRSSTGKSMDDNNKCDNKLFDSMTMGGGVRRDLPPTPSAQMTSGGDFHPGKFVLGSGTPNMSPSHHHHPQHLYLSSGNLAANGVPLGLSVSVMDYNNGYHTTSSGHLQHHNNILGQHYSNTGGRMSPAGNYQHAHSSGGNNGHPGGNYPGYPPPPPPPNSSSGGGGNPPVIVHYEYQYPDYIHPGNSTSNSVHRVKQVPSVLV